MSKKISSKFDQSPHTSFRIPSLGTSKDSFSQNKFGLGVLKGDRRTSKILMIPTIKGITQRKLAEERQEEFLRSYYEKKGRSFAVDESMVTSKVTSRPTSRQ